MSESQNSSRNSRVQSGEGRRPKYPFAGPAGRIRMALQENKQKKWGFLIYRCDYSSDDAWKKFQTNVQSTLDSHLKILKAEDLRDTMDMTIKEDKGTLDGATVDQVRDIFKEWVQSNEARAENEDPLYATLFQSPRYVYCVHVDTAAIESVVSRAPQPPEHDFHDIGYVTLVRLDYPDSSEGIGSDVSELNDYEDDGEDFTRMNDVKVPISYLGPESYSSLEKDSTWVRYVQYRREDGVSYG